MWRNEAVSSFVDWLHDHNAQRAPDRRVGFYGLDLYSLHSSIHAVLRYLEDNDPDVAARARDRYACFDHTELHREGLGAHLGLGRRFETEVVAMLVEMQRLKSARSGRSPDGDAWFQAIQQAHVVRNAEAYYRMMFAGHTAAWNVRDAHMADTIDLLSQHLGCDIPAKLVVWAHNSHVGDARATEMGGDAQVTLGQIMRQRYPGEVALVGLTTYEGHVIAASDWDQPPERKRVRPALPGSWEQLFHAVEIPSFYLTAEALRRAVDSDNERLLRAIGVVYRPHTERGSHYFCSRIADELDLIIHVDTTSGIEPLDPVDVVEEPATAEDLPETYPEGV
jgi:erythromycin esterase-like protein